MIETIKKMLLAGLGAGVMTRDRVRSTLDGLADRGEITREQAARLLDVLVTTGEREERVRSEKLTREINRILQKGPFVMRHEFDALQKRLRRLESAMGAEAPSEVDPPGPVEAPEEVEAPGAGDRSPEPPSEGAGHDPSP